MGAFWRQNARLLKILVALLACAILLGGSMPLLIPTSARSHAANLLAMVGILLLSVPAIRLNEQARQIYRVQTLANAAREDIDVDHDRINRLVAIEQELVSQKGGWSPFVQGLLYAGYALLFASAVARLTGSLLE